MSFLSEKALNSLVSRGQALERDGAALPQVADRAWRAGLARSYCSQTQRATRLDLRAILGQEPEIELALD